MCLKSINERINYRKFLSGVQNDSASLFPNVLLFVLLFCQQESAFQAVNSQLMIRNKNQKLLRSFKFAAETFREYLKYSGAELPSLESIFPKTNGNSSECVEFHRSLCKTMVEDGHSFIGIKVIPSTHEGICCFRESGVVCVPLFSCHTGNGTIEIAKYRVQYVESSICIRLGSDSKSAEMNSVLRGSSCSLALEVTGTRFPFYPPSVDSFACDLAGLIGFFKGPDVPVHKIGDDGLINHHCVLSHNGEPVQIGCGKMTHGGSPFSSLKEASKYADQVGIPLQRDNIVLCGGVCPRFMVQRGNYQLNWGLFGNTSCAIK